MIIVILYKRLFLFNYFNLINSGQNDAEIKPPTQANDFRY
ncbi:hypothetical protein PARMER_02567 [Parabacteroides merdae ATCC 43184]|nr:hypothetical protein PARMER_02567 [Parabacteroides merdae ATCC 43184]